MPVVEFAHIHRRFLTQTRSQPQFVQATWAVTISGVCGYGGSSGRQDFGPHRDRDRMLRAAAWTSAGTPAGTDRARAGHPAPVPARGHAVAQLAGQRRQGERLDPAPCLRALGTHGLAANGVNRAICHRSDDATARQTLHHLQVVVVNDHAQSMTQAKNPRKKRQHYKRTLIYTRACRQLSQVRAAARWMPPRKFRAVLS